MSLKQLTRAPAAPSLSPSPRWPPLQGWWTYKDYKSLPDNGMRYEVIEGELYMTPVPNTKHQRILAKLYGYLWDYLKQYPVGELFFAPIDVRLKKLANPVQPDLLFIAQERLEIVKEEYIEGAPDLVVEALSPGTQRHDRRTKFNLYARAGVREYWLIDPDTCTLEIYVLRGQAYAPLGTFDANDEVRSEVLENLQIKMQDICPA